MAFDELVRRAPLRRRRPGLARPRVARCAARLLLRPRLDFRLRWPWCVPPLVRRSCGQARRRAASVRGAFSRPWPCHHCRGGYAMKAFASTRTAGRRCCAGRTCRCRAGAGEVRIRHTAVALNFRDILVSRGQHAVKSLPSGLGTESAGVIEAIGAGRHRLAAGDRVACVAGPTAPMPRRASRRPRASSSCRTASTSAPRPR